MGKKYYLGERAARLLDKVLPYIDQQMRTTRFSNRRGTPLFGGKAFLAKITSVGPNEEEDFTDPRYWIREVINTNSDNDHTSMLIFEYPEKPEDLDMEDWRQVTHWDVAVNTKEINSESHLLSTNDDILVVVYTKADQNNLTRYHFTYLPKNWFLGKVHNLGPNSEANYTDQRYWIKEQIITNIDEDDTSDLTWADSISDNALWVTATNLAEVTNQSHDFPDNNNYRVLVFRNHDATGVARYVFNSLAIVVD